MTIAMLIVNGARDRSLPTRDCGYIYRQLLKAAGSAEGPRALWSGAP